MWIVNLAADSGLVRYGPFRSEGDAERFARYLVEEEVGPAAVQLITPFSVPGLRSPVAELLDWRDRVHAIVADRAITALTGDAPSPPAAADAPETADPNERNSL